MAVNKTDLQSPWGTSTVDRVRPAARPPTPPASNETPAPHGWGPVLHQWLQKVEDFFVSRSATPPQASGVLLDAPTPNLTLSQMTLAELVDQLQQVPTMKGTAEQKRARYVAIEAAVTKLSPPVFGSGFTIAHDEAAARAQVAIGGVEAVRLAEKEIAKEVAGFEGHNPPPPPNPKIPVGDDAQLSALAASRMSYGVNEVSQLEGQGFTGVRGIDGVDPKGGTLGHVLVGLRTDPDPSRSIFLVDFKGTTNFKDAYHDLDVAPEDATANYGGGHVHSGFAQELDAMWPQLKGEIARAHQAGVPVLFTGHSLGAALAVLALARAQKEGLLGPPPYSSAVAKLYTYGQPAVGDSAFNRAFMSNLAGVPYTRFVYRSDPVPEFPPGKIFGYQHIDSARIVYYAEDGSTILLNDKNDPRLHASKPEDWLHDSQLHYSGNYLIMAERDAKPAR